MSNLPGQAMPNGVCSSRLGPPLLAALLAAGPAQAQIVTDGSVGPRASLSGPQVEIGADLGTRRGDNLFHSFETFGIATGQSATFKGPDTIRNVISRVTGGEISTIDGTLASEVGQADLYLLNPAGVVFGPNARLEVPGSFHVSTAHELRFADGARFSALDKTGSGLTVAAPEAFGFLERSPGRIAVDQSQLQLEPGKTLSLVGGDIDIAGGPSGFMAVEGGTTTLAAVASAGQVRVLDGAVDAARQGAIRVSDQALVDVSGNGGGTIRILSSVLEVRNSAMLANNTGERDSTTGLDLQAGSIEVSNSGLTTDVLGSGRGGTVKIKAGQLAIRNGGLISSDTYGSGDAGTVAVRADHLLISSDGSPRFTGIASSAERGSSGAAGTVQVAAGDLQLRNGSEISSNTFASGNAGTVAVQADHLLISGDGSPYFTGIASGAEPGSTGAAGTVQVAAGDLQLRSGGIISSGTIASGDAGTVAVRADHLLISGDGAPRFTGIASQADGSSGDAGNVQVTAGDLQLRDGGIISSGTWGRGDAGTVAVQADHLLISRDGSPYFTGIASQANRGSTGAAGNVQVTASGAIELRNGGRISSDTFASGDAGTVQVQADQLLISGASTSISSLAGANSSGAGGAVSVGARTMQVRDGGTVSTQSNGSGVGGPITIDVMDKLDLDHAAIQSQTAIANGGDIRLAVGRLFDLRNSAVTTSVAGGTGSGGNIAIDPPLMVLNQSRIEANAKQGAGGNITIRAGQLISTPNSVIDASGTVAGNIVITAPDTDVSSSLVVLPGTFLDAGSQLRTACASRGGRPASSLTAGGRGGLPPDPDAPLVASPFEPPLTQQAATGAPTALTPRSPQAAKPVSVAGTPQPALGAPRPACRG